VSSDKVMVAGGCIFICQSGGSFVLMDRRKSDGDTFNNCGAYGGKGYGGGLYILNKGGNCKIGGSKLSFSNCKAKNGTKILIETEDLKTAIEERILIDFNYESSNNDDIIGISINNIYSTTPLHLYDCLIKSKMKQNEIDICSVHPTCSLSCPTSTVISIIIIIFPINKI
jgi:hypothetical protein